MTQDSPAFKIKHANLPLFVVHAMTPDMAQFKQQLQAHLAQAPDFFSGTPVVLGLAAIAGAQTTPDFGELTDFMRQRGMAIAGVLGGSEAQRQAALDSGLGLFPDPPPRTPREELAAQPPLSEAPPNSAEAALPKRAIEVPASAQQPGAREEPAAIPMRRPTLVIDRPVRTGQRIHAEGGDLVVLAVVNAGAELIADGNIHVYAPLRGRALAGARGDASARIFTQCMEAELVSIAGYFQVFEEGIPEGLRGKPVQIFFDGQQVVLHALISTRQV
jgi:septum site-determining protein MinC